MKNYSKKTPKKLSRFRTPSLYLARKTRDSQILKARERTKWKK